MEKIHFIAIGGSAMHSLALALNASGKKITGSDDQFFDPSKSKLQEAGLLPNHTGWNVNNIHSGLDAVILGMHAKGDNPELLKAKELNLPIFSYPEYIYELSKNKTRVVIAGSHGKTTITAMILHAMNYHNRDIDFMLGAQLEGIENPVQLTSHNEFMLIEGDEYLASALQPVPKIHFYKPNITLISGIAWDHYNVFPTFKNYCEQFAIYLKDVSDGGAVIYNEEDTEVVKIVEGATNFFKKFAYSTPNHTIKNGVTYLHHEQYGEIPLEVFGNHNLQNMEGARLICNQMGLGNDDFFEAIVSFKGASKRLQKIYSQNSNMIFRDFAHAPSKVKASTSAISEQFEDFNTIAVLELHTYSSLNPEFMVQYKNCLKGVSTAIVYYDPKALEIKKLPPLQKETILNAFDSDSIIICNSAEILKEEITKNMSPTKNCLLFMSSGNFGGLSFNFF